MSDDFYKGFRRAVGFVSALALIVLYLTVVFILGKVIIELTGCSL